MCAQPIPQFIMKLIHHKLPLPQFDNENCAKIVIYVLDAQHSCVENTNP